MPDPDYILDTWSEAWVDLGDYSLLHPEPIAQLWRAINTKRTTMQQTQYVAFTEAGLFTIAALGFPDGTNPAHIMPNRDIRYGTTNLKKQIIRTAGLVKYVVIGTSSYRWATGTPASYTFVEDLSLPISANAESLESWGSVIDGIRTELDKLDLLIKVASTGVTMTRISNTKQWAWPSKKSNFTTPAIRITGFTTLGLRAFQNAEINYPYPWKYVDQRSTPFTYGPTIGYGKTVQPTGYSSTLAGATSFTYREVYDYPTKKITNAFGSYIDFPSAVTKALSFSFVRPLTLFLGLALPESPCDSVDTVATFTSTTTTNTVDTRFTGDYYSDGGYLISNTNSVDSAGYGGCVVCSYGGIQGVRGTTTTASYSGYIAGNITSYTLAPAGCPVSVSVSIGAFDLVNNRTPVTITTGALSDPLFCKTNVVETVPARTLTVGTNAYSYESAIDRRPVLTETGIASNGEKVNAYLFGDRELQADISVTAPAYDELEWLLVSGEWKVTFS